MPNTYTILNSRGSTLTTIAETQRDSTSTSLVLHGRGAIEYGLQRDENIVHLLENFSSSSGPSNPIDGQLWWDTSVDAFNVWNEDLGSPVGSGDWESLIPGAAGVGFVITAGDGLVSDPADGFPSGSPDTGITLDVDNGNGLTFSAGQLIVSIGSPTPGLSFNPGGGLVVDATVVDHDLLFNFVANEHIDHTSVAVTVGTGLTLINVSGDITTSFDYAVDFSEVVRRSTNQTIGGIKTFSDGLLGPNASAGTPTYGFTTSPGTGMYRSSASEIGFATAGISRFRIESTGVLRSLNLTYEALVTEDDDIPNKKYVDDAAIAGVARGCLAYGTVSQIMTSTVEGTVFFNSEAFDTDSIHSTVSNTGRLTVPAGVTKIRLTGHVAWQANADPGYRRIRFRKNGVNGGIDLNRGIAQPEDVHINGGLGIGAGNLDGKTHRQLTSGLIETVAGNYFELRAQSFGVAVLAGGEQWFEMEIIA